MGRPPVILLPLIVAVVGGEVCDPSECTGMGGKCPDSQGLVSQPMGMTSSKAFSDRENVYFRNAAPWAAQILHVDSNGVEGPRGILPPGMRRALPTFHGDVWRARAVTDGPANGRLLLEHRIGAIKIRACECPQPEFVDCSKTPISRPAGYVSDPVVFENDAGEPVDLFFWNGAPHIHGPRSSRPRPPPACVPAHRVVASSPSPPRGCSARSPIHPIPTRCRHVRGAGQLG